MSNRFERLMALTGVAAVALWIAGLAVMNGMSDSISDSATDAQILTWAQHNTTTLIVGAWLFAIGCLCFLWFGGVLRTRLAAAEESSTVSTIAFAGLVATGIFGILIPLGDFAAAINTLVAIVLVIGPIGWAALIFGLPVWTLVTSGLLLRAPRARRAAVPAPAGA